MPFASESQRRWMYANEPEMAKKWQEHTPKGKKLPEKVKKAVDASVEGFLTPITESARQIGTVIPRSEPDDLSGGIEQYLEAKEELKRQGKEKDKSLLRRALNAAALGAGIGGVTGTVKGYLGSKVLPNVNVPTAAITMAGLGAAGGAGLVLARALLQKKLKSKAEEVVEGADPAVRFAANHPNTHRAAKDWEEASWMPWRGVELGALTGGLGGLLSGKLSGGSIPTHTVAGSLAGAALGGGLGYLYSKFKKRKFLDSIQQGLADVRSPKAQEAVIEAEVENTPALLKAAAANPWVSAVIAPVGDGLYAGSSRPLDKVSDGVTVQKLYGLPGGKIDPGESPRDAAIREAAEEGWDIEGVSNEPIYQTDRPDGFNGKLVLWYLAQKAKMRKDYKEKHRLRPVLLTADDIMRKTDIEDDKAMEAYLAKTKTAESVDDLAANLRQQYQTYRSRPYALDMYGHNPYATGHYSEGAKTQYTFNPYDANLGLTAGTSVPFAPARPAAPSPERIAAVEKAGLADLYPSMPLEKLPLPQLKQHFEAVYAERDKLKQEQAARIQAIQAEADQIQNRSQQSIQRNKDLIAKWKARDAAKQEQMAKFNPPKPAAPTAEPGVTIPEKPLTDVQTTGMMRNTPKPAIAKLPSEGMTKLNAALEDFIKQALDGRGPIVASNGIKMRGMGGPPNRFSAARGGAVIDETHRPKKLAEVEQFEQELKKIAQLNKKVKIAESKRLRERSEVIVDNGTGILGIKKDGYLLMPGGGINEGESAEEAIKRETVEEADMHIKDVKFVSTIDSLFNPDKPIMPEYDGESTNFFTAKAGDKANENHEDNEDFKFIPYAEAIEFLTECLKKPENEWALQNNAQRLILISELDKPKNVELVKEADVATFIPKKETLAFTPNGKLLIKALGDRRIELPGEVEGATPVPYEQAVKFVPEQGIPEPGAHGYEYHLQQAEVPGMEGFEEMDPDEVLKNLYASLGKPQNKQYQALDRSRARAILRILKKRKPNLPLPTI